MTPPADAPRGPQGASSPSPPGRELGILLLLTALGAALRLPFLIESLSIPVDGDTAIIGLMARHHVWTGTMWGQPYGSPVESWFAVPFVEVLGTSRLALRLCYFTLSLALVPLAWALGRVLDRRAGLPAAALLAVPPAVLVTFSALPPPLYPTAILLVGSLLLAALVAAERLPRTGDRFALPLAAWALLSGLALWTHLVSAAAVGASGLLLVLQARSRPWRALGVAAAGCLAALPSLLVAAREPGSLRIAASTLDHARHVLPQMPYPLVELIGGRVWVISAGDHEVVSPLLGQAALVGLYLGATLLALRTQRRAAALTLAGAVLVTVLVFPFPVRSDLAGVRFLTPAYLPLAVLLAAGATVGLGRARWVPVGLVVGLHVPPLPGLFGHWHAARHTSAFFPDCSDGLETMEALGLRRGYASYNTAYCITWESGERIVVSQPWNERFVHHPLPYLDEVRFAGPAVGWVLRPGFDFMAVRPPEEFERQLRRAGGSWERRVAGATFVYHSFVPPFSATVVPHAVEGPAGDGDPATRVVKPARGPSTVEVPVPRPLSGLTLLGGAGAPLLPRSLLVEVSDDGVRFEKVLRRRRDREHVKLVWLNGQPQYPIDDRALSAPLEGQRVSHIRVTPLGDQGPWSLAEVLLHEEKSVGPWIPDGDPADSDWAGWRRALASRPQPHDAAWLYRTVLASDHP